MTGRDLARDVTPAEPMSSTDGDGPTAGCGSP